MALDLPTPGSGAEALRQARGGLAAAPRIARAFQGKPVLPSRNRGVTVAAPGVAEAFRGLRHLERARKRRHPPAASGAPRPIVSDDRAARAQASLAEGRVRSPVLHLEVHERRLDRDETEDAR